MRDDDTYPWDDESDLECFECLWCHERRWDRIDDPAMHYPYCSSQCSLEAERDSEEDAVSPW